MNKKQRLAVTIAGSALALGMIFNRPIKDICNKLTNNEELYQARYVQYPEPGPGAGDRVTYQENQYRTDLTKDDLELLHSKQRLGLIGELTIKPYNKQEK